MIRNKKMCARPAYFLVGIWMLILSCDTQIEEGVMESDLSKDIEMVTDYGSIIMRLSDETPKHRNNFIKKVNERFYDSISFHRVIDNFIIQSGDQKTKPSYVEKNNTSFHLPEFIEAEFRPNLFHKRGVLNAAREGDQANLNRFSSDSQFTIIQGKKQTDSTLNVSQKRINRWRAKNKVMRSPEYAADFKKFQKLYFQMEEMNASDLQSNTAKDSKIRTDFAQVTQKMKGYNFDSLATIELETIKKYSYPASHREAYKTLGGAPHLDQTYTVFGAVVKGMNVVDSIAATVTDKGDKPLRDIYILNVRMIQRKNYNELK